MNWIQRKRQWAAQKPLFWLNLLFLLATVIVVFIWTAAGSSDFRVRTWGMVLQLIGVGTVWFDLSAMARSFGREGVIRATWKWFKAGIFGQDGIATMTGVAAASSSGKARAKARWPIDPNASDEFRLAAVEKNLSKIDEDLDAAFAEIDKVEGELKARIREECERRGAAISAIRREFEEVAVGNSSVLLFGVVWLAAGVLLATWAPEIAKVAAGQWGVVASTL